MTFLYFEENFVVNFDCIVKLSKIDENTLRNLRSSNRGKHVSFQSDTAIPAKRNRRLASLALENPGSSKESKEKSNITPAKRNRRSDSTPQQCVSSGEPNDTISKVVTMNCKLTNEILVAKKQLCEKTEDIVKLQESLHKKEMKCKDLQSETADLAKKIKQMEEIIEQMRAENFCNDLIDFEAGQVSGEFEFSLYM